MVGIKLQEIAMWCFFLVPLLMLHTNMAYGKTPLRYKDTDITFDWRTRGVISAVASQNNFISAWEEVARESIESLHAIQTGKLLNLSTEEVHDCCPAAVQVSSSFQCLVNLGGLCKAGSYEKWTDKCQNGSCSVVAKVTGWNELTPNREDLMVKTIQTTPLMVGINASSIMTYTSGIFDDPDCGTELNHYVQLVGYGSQDGKDFWIAKNSWGSFWGIHGYIYVSRGKNMCGIANDVSYPVNQ